MQVIAQATEQVVRSLANQILEALDGIPDDALGTWMPSAASDGGEMNTFAAIAVHTASSGRWMLNHMVLGEEVARDREAEFRATATQAQIRALYAEWMEELAANLARLDEVDLAQLPPSIRPAHPDWNRAAWLLHMVDHTGIHAGHVQIQRQLWDAEQANGAS